MSKYTPAPWFICHKDEPLEEDGSIVQGFNDHEIRPAVGTKLGDEMADLRLASLAPEMLPLLKQALEEPPTGVRYLMWANAVRAIIKEINGI